MRNDREGLIAAINSTRNLGDAARALDVSRRTLQNRMREYALPPGRGGRPKAELTYSPTAGLTLGNITAAALLIGGGYLVGRWLARPGSDKQIVTGAAVLGAL